MKKPWYKRWKVWGGTFAVLFVIGAFAPDDIDPEDLVEAEKTKTAVEKPKEVAVSKEKTPEELAAEKVKAEAKKKADEAAVAKTIADEAAKAKIKAEADAKAKVAAEAKKAADAKTKADADIAVEESLQAIIDLSNGVVIDIIPSPYGSDDWMTTWVIVSDAWYNSADHEKERFAESVGNAVKFALNGEASLVHFYDSYDKELAKEKILGGYKIKR